MARVVFGFDRQPPEYAETAEAWMPADPIPVIRGWDIKPDPGTSWILIRGRWHRFANGMRGRCGARYRDGSARASCPTRVAVGDPPEPRCRRTACRP